MCVCGGGGVFRIHIRRIRIRNTGGGGGSHGLVSGGVMYTYFTVASVLEVGDELCDLLQLGRQHLLVAAVHPRVHRVDHA